jgi:hypothetical protein
LCLWKIVLLQHIFMCLKFVGYRLEVSHDGLTEYSTVTPAPPKWCLYIFTLTDARISSTWMLPSGCAIMRYTLYAQLFLQPQLILHRERIVSTVTQFLRLQRVLHKEKSSVKMDSTAIKRWINPCHSLTLRVLYKAGYYYYVTNFRWIFYAQFTNFPVNNKCLPLYEASTLVKHSSVYTGFQSHTTQSFANVYYLAISFALKIGHHQATVFTFLYSGLMMKYTWDRN